MGEYGDKHLPWARQFLSRHDPEYQFRWDVYFDELERLAADAANFLDLGCGDNKTVRELTINGSKIGLDMAIPNDITDFCCGDAEALPFANETFDLIGCRFVLEHLPHPDSVFREVQRVLRPGGLLLTQTTNKRHPLVALGRLLPQRVKRILVYRIYGRSGGTDYPTYHRFNHPRDFSRPYQGLEPIRSWYIEDLHLESKALFYLSYAYHRLTKRLQKHRWRSTITTLWQKPVESSTGE